MSKSGGAVSRAVASVLYPLDPGALVILAFYAGMACALIIAYVTSLEVEARKDRADLEAEELEMVAVAHMAAALATPSATPRATPSGKRPVTAAQNGRVAQGQAQKVTIERGASSAEGVTHD